jgi:hypothetical protein
MVVAVPDWDIFNNPKERPRSSKKPIVFEEPVVEVDAENENQEQGNNDEHDSINEMVDNPENTRAAQEKVGTSELKGLMLLRRKRDLRREMKDLHLLKKEKRLCLLDLLRGQRLWLKDLQRRLLALQKVMFLSLILVAILKLKLKTNPLLAQR